MIIDFQTNAVTVPVDEMIYLLEIKLNHLKEIQRNDLEWDYTNSIEEVESQLELLGE